MSGSPTTAALSSCSEPFQVPPSARADALSRADTPARADALSPANAPVHANAPARALSPAEAPSRIGRLLSLIRRLIDYGSELAITLRQNASATTLDTVTLHFGRTDIAVILALITRALIRAGVLETRLIRYVPRQQASRHDAPATTNAPPPPGSPAAQPAKRRAKRVDDRLVCTPEEIEAADRHRTVGAVLADICRDLGLVPASPLWRELSMAIIENDGNLAALLTSTFDRTISGDPRRPLSVPLHHAWPPSQPPAEPQSQPPGELPAEPQFAEACGTTDPP